MHSLLVIGSESHGGANDRSLFSVLETVSSRTQLAHVNSQKSSKDMFDVVNRNMGEGTYIERDFALTLNIVQESIHRG